ncbi:MAG: archease [Gammaproteobacteria bacterium]|nr:archease [Gammaproteobacteria bacterium]
MKLAEQSAPQSGWSHFPHGADVGVQGFGPTPSVAFEQVAAALTALITDPASVRPDSAVHIACKSNDLETLLVDWLNALIYEMAVRHMLFSWFQVRILNSHLEAEAWGETVDPVRHQPVVEPKGATYTELRVTGDDHHWIAQCIVDV